MLGSRGWQTSGRGVTCTTHTSTCRRRPAARCCSAMVEHVAPATAVAMVQNYALGKVR